MEKTTKKGNIMHYLDRKIKKCGICKKSGVQNVKSPGYSTCNTCEPSCYRCGSVVRRRTCVNCEALGYFNYAIAN